MRKPAVVLSVVPQELGRAIAGACETIDVEQGDTFDGPQDHPDRLVEDEWHAQQGPFGDAFKVLRRDRDAGRAGLERLPVRRVRVREPHVHGGRVPCVAVSDAERERAMIRWTRDRVVLGTPGFKIGTRHACGRRKERFGPARTLEVLSAVRGSSAICFWSVHQSRRIARSYVVG